MIEDLNNFLPEITGKYSLSLSLSFYLSFHLCLSSHSLTHSLTLSLSLSLSLSGFAAVSAQPNSGAQGEYSGLLCIKKYHEARGEFHRESCLSLSLSLSSAFSLLLSLTHPLSLSLSFFQVTSIETSV
jgi:hypothetical protein